MSVITIVTNILAVIGLIVLFAYIVYYLWKYLQDRNQQELDMKISPPNDYMQQTGIKCPDYWVNTETDTENKTYTCKNVNNVAPPQKSVNDECSKVNCSIDPTGNDLSTVKFSLLPDGQTWESGNPNGLTSMTNDQKNTFVTKKPTKDDKFTASRCDWIKCCGAYNVTNDPDNKTMNPAVWLGVNDICNSAAAPPSM